MNRVTAAELRHQLRTPLNHIIGYTEMLLEDVDAPAHPELSVSLEKILEEARRVFNLVQKQLGVSPVATEEYDLDSLRKGMLEPLYSIGRSIGAVSREARDEAFIDVLRVSSATADLLAFAQGRPIRTEGLSFSALPDRPASEMAQGGRILAVDDNEASREMLRRQLERLGYSCETAQSGEEALDRLAESHFDALLLDLMMPGMNGIQVLDAIQANKTLREIPVVIMSALDDLSGIVHCMGHGAEDYIFKPAEPVLLQARLKATLERRRLQNVERHRAQELEAAGKDLRRSNDELQRFAYATSHDLKEPLRMVSNYVQLLNRRVGPKLEAEEKDYMNFVLEGTKRMQDLINDLLAYAQVSTGDRVLAPVDLNEVVRGVILSLHIQVEESGAAIEYEKLPVLVVDRAQVERLFQNLVSNAIKYRSAKPPRIRIVSAYQDGEWNFTVADNGIGIDPRYVAKIFEMFQRLHGRNIPGTGIGLAICQRVVERLGGRIWAESIPGEGSMFRFTIPQQAGAGSAFSQTGS